MIWFVVIGLSSRASLTCIILQPTSTETLKTYETCILTAFWLKPRSRFCNTSSAQAKSCWVFKRGPPNTITPIHIIYHKPKFSQLSCTLLVPIRLSHQLDMLLELRDFSTFARLHPVSCISTVLDEIGCSVSAWLWCQLRCNLSAQLPLAY